MTDPIAARGVQPGTIGEGHHDGRGFIHGTGCDRVVHYAQGCPEHMGEYGDWQLNPSAVRETQPGTGDTVFATRTMQRDDAARGAQPGTEAGRELTDVDTIYVLMERVRKAVPKIEAEARQQGRETLDVERLEAVLDTPGILSDRPRSQEFIRELAADIAREYATLPDLLRTLPDLLRVASLADALVEADWSTEGIRMDHLRRLLRAALAADPRPETEGTE